LYKRPFAHFYDPQHQGRGLTVAGVQLGPSSLDWVLKRDAGTTATGSNHFTYQDAREAFYKALTRRDAGGANSAADQARDRAEQWAITFQTLGHVVHHLQDMAQPQHVRNDQHCDSTVAFCGGLGNPSGYEKYIQGQSVLVRNLAATATAPMLFGLPREFWNINTNNAYQTTNTTTHAPIDQGLAAYTATNFVSAGTDFSIERNGNVRTPMAAVDFDFPRPSATPNNVTLETLFQDSQPSPGLDYIRDQLCAGNLANCKMRFYGSEVDPTARKSSMSYFSQEYLGGRNTPTRGKAGYFTQNYWTYVDSVSRLVPSAVNYSAGLINYFFRGEMQISLPEEGVYGIVDHAVEKEKNAHGFRLIKATVKNTTPPITMNYPRPGGGDMIVPQHMTGGTFVAVAKFHRNTCYTPDLKGQIGQIGNLVVTGMNTWAACRAPLEEIVVSAPATEWSATSGAAITAETLNTGAEKTLAFDFSANPIPIEATDLFIQVVFKGKLGEEVDAVAVTTKSISEPSFVTHVDSRDKVVCDARTTSSCETVDSLVGANVAFRNNEPAFSECTNTGSFTGLNRWLGFNLSQPSVRVVEWWGATPNAQGTPIYKSEPGTYSRVAVLADIDLPDRNHNWSLTDGTATKTIRQGDLPLVFGLFRQWTAPSVPTLAMLTPAFSRVALTQVKINPDDTAPTVDKLPKYMAIREAVVGVQRDRPEDPNAMPLLMNSCGEPATSGGDWGGLPAHASVYERGPALNGAGMPAGGSPKPVAEIRFAASPAFVLPTITDAELGTMEVSTWTSRYTQPRTIRTGVPTNFYVWWIQ
jgi:hypothetical protein